MSKNIDKEEFKKLCRKCDKPKESKIDISLFKKYLKDYPNAGEKVELLQHIQGYTHDIHGNWDSIKTLPKQVTSSAKKFSDICDLYYINEMLKGRIICITDLVKSGKIPEPKIWIPFTVVIEPKPRCVFNYSHTLNGISINSLVPDSAATIKLTTIPTVATKILNLGPTCKIGKHDLKDAFRQNIKNKSEVYMIAYFWRNEILVDWYMPWGTRNAARKCHLVSKGIIHATEKFLPITLHGQILCYIDDFMFFAKNEIECNILMDTFENICKILGYEIKMIKKENANSNQVLLGRKFNCPTLWVKAQDKKLEKYKQKLIELLKVSHITQKNMLSIEGSLTNIAPLAWPLKCLLRRFRNAIPYNKDNNTLIFVSQTLKDEAKMWLKLIDSLNGIPMQELLPGFDPPIDEIISFDAGNEGFGAFYEPYWLCAPFHKYEVQSGKKNNIAHRELTCCKAAVNAWSSLWTGKHILFRTDSIVVYYALMKKDSRDKFLMDLVREICLTAINKKFRFFIKWVPREQNTIADALSKLDIKLFKKLCFEQKRKCVEFPMLFERPFGTF